MHLARRRKSSALKSPREHTPSTETAGKEKSGKVETPLADLDFHFVVDSALSKATVYEYFNFSSNTSFSCGIDPFETIGQAGKNATDIYICFCDSPLGPCDPTSFAHTISLYVNFFYFFFFLCFLLSFPVVKLRYSSSGM